ncbi:MAG TPA: glycosyltransferase [Syntrophomonas sp.]|nr:glycosyltransferase [Syntrophomonas sp.]
MKRMDYEIIIPSHRPQLRRGAQLCLKHLNNRILDGTGYPSFSKLINDCIVSSRHENIIICNDEARPPASAVEKILDMLDKGWGIVAPYRFGFFGLKKDLIRKIGFFDERYIGGGYEDNDMILRLKEANISYYEKEEIPYIHLPSSWHYEKLHLSRIFYHKKWRLEGDIYTRQLAEENYGYDIGPFQDFTFLPFDQSVLLPVRRNLIEQTIQVDLLK